MKKQNIAIKLSAFLLSGILCFPAVFASAENAGNAAETVSVPTQQTGEYSDYLSANEEMNNAAEDISADLTDAGGSNFSASLSVPADGLYELELSYSAVSEKNATVSLTIDGGLPFDEADRLVFPVFWRDGERKAPDAQGNEFSPDIIAVSEPVSSYAMDYSGHFEGAFRFALSAGSHTVNLRVKSGEINIHSLTFKAPADIKSYSKKQIRENLSLSEPIVIEGEDAVLKNNRSLIDLSDTSSPLISPSDPYRAKMNYVGGSNWKNSGDSFTWQFTAPESGWYGMGFVYRQGYNIGGVSYRSLKIDGEVPFKECSRIKFGYNEKWSYTEFSKGDTPYYIYLEKGEHTLTLAATAGPFSEVYHRLKNVAAEMGDLYVDITAIVGETVDSNRSYELFNQIPQFNEKLQSISKQLDKIARALEIYQGQSSGSDVSTIRNISRVVNLMIENPYTAHRYKSDYYDGYTNLSSLIGEITEMPLDLDRIILFGKGSENYAPSVSFFKKIGFSAKRFFSSFIGEYGEKNADDSAVTIWVNWGRDQAQILNDLVRDDFKQKTGINASISIVNATLIQAILSGSGPDVLLQLERTEPLNYAMRGALYDLTQFSDCSEVLERFNKNAECPYRYNGGLYALPDTQQFNMMFVRTDILSGMGIEIPETWDELIKASNLLQRNNLQVYVPGTGIYTTLLIQKNLPLYNDELSASTMKETPQILLFEKMTEWYTKYKLPVTADFYNRFRIGSCPIGIQSYTVYTQLKAAAPEIDGRWTVALLPGFADENGNINHYSAGTGTGCAITKFAKSPENAWKFLKWWTSAETQTRYSGELEAALGPLGRLAVSNSESFESMDWDTNMEEIILKQRQQTDELPEVPGGYYTTRCLTQAFWEVVENGNTSLEAMIKWGEILNNEIARTRADYIS